MPSKIVTSFEVLSRPIAPLVPNVPYVQQGFFIQVTNMEKKAVGVEVLFQDTPAFVANKGAIKLFVNYIDNMGAIQQYNVMNFLEPPVGFAAIPIPAASTFLYGVQYLLLPPPAPVSTAQGGVTPQDSLEARGVVTLVAPDDVRLVVQSTTRQLFNNYQADGAVLDISEAAYVNPLIGGPMLTF